MNCPSCGAVLGQADARCAYCGAVTPYGAQLQHQQRQHEAHLDAVRAHQENNREQQRLNDARRSLKRTASHTLYWSLAGLLFCCAFVPSVVAIVMGIRARKMAAEYDLVLPVQATAGLVLGVFGVVMGAGLITIGIVEDGKRKDRIEALERRLGGKAAQAELQQPTACALAEKRLLQGGFGDSKSVDDYECDGRLLQDQSTATLHDVRFERSGKLITLKACLERGERWSVTGFRSEATCQEPDDTEKASTKGGSSKKSGASDKTGSSGKSGATQE